MTRRVGLWLIGAYGGVGSTVALGLASLRRGLIPTTGLVTARPEWAGHDLDDPAAFVVGGHDIRPVGFFEAAQELHRRAGVFSPQILAACRPDLDAWSAHVRPGTLSGAGETIASLCQWPEAHHLHSPRSAVRRIQDDLQAFRERHALEQVVVINVASTEPPVPQPPAHGAADLLRELLDKDQEGLVPASSLYALGAILAGCSYVNFTPSLGANFPAAIALAEEKRVCLAGQDGKTGETLLKSVLAPLFAARNLRVLSWVGHNIFGNRDGWVLNDPRNKESKIRTKDQVIAHILGYHPQTLVTIEYIESLDDWKTAWDHIHFQGFFGTKMVVQFIWQGCDSLLAAPLVIDLARLVLAAHRAGQRGVLVPLACFFKNPMGTEEHDFFEQWRMLRDFAARLPRVP
ncbi:MAG: myo-inositol-1-phosphate synthase [Gemmataceae bacterium]